MGKCQSGPSSSDNLELPNKDTGFKNRFSKRDEPESDFANTVSNIPTLSTEAQNRLDQLGPFKYDQMPNQERGKQLQPYQLKNGSIYVGEWKKGKTHGRGKYYLPDGSYFEGYSCENEIRGIGRIIHPNGDYFSGELQDGVANGPGIYVENDITYEGNFNNNLQHGQGKQYSSLYEYNGTFSEGSKQTGTLILKNKDKYEYNGPFKNNKFHGEGVLINDVGKYEGVFVEGVKEGLGKFTWADGSYYQGEYFNDQKHGQGTYVDNKGRQLKKGAWKNDKFIG